MTFGERVKATEQWINTQANWLLGETWRMELATVAVQVFDDLRTERPGERPDENEFRRRVERKMLGTTAIPAWILIVIAQFLLGKLLEWLWDNWTDKVDS